MNMKRLEFSQSPPALPRLQGPKARRLEAGVDVGKVDGAGAWPVVEAEIAQHRGAGFVLMTSTRQPRQKAAEQAQPCLCNTCQRQVAPGEGLVLKDVLSISRRRRLEGSSAPPQRLILETKERIMMA
jgi:hypothetical protein